MTAVCLCVLVSTYEQLFSVYFFAVFIIHLTVVLFLNIHNTPALLHGNYHPMELLTFDSFVVLCSPVMISWIVYIGSVIVYALAFRSIKPIIISLSLMPIYLRYLREEHQQSEDPTFAESCSFGIGVFILLQTAHKLLAHLTELVKYQARIIMFRFRMYGGLVLFVLHWRRLKLSSVLTFYWILIWNYQMVIFTIFIDERFHLSFILACMAYACNSFVKVASFCYVIQHVVKVILNAFKNIVKDQHTFIDEGHTHPNGLRESIGFLFLSLYTSLTSINPSKRIVLMELLLLLLASALIRSLFEIVEPYLHALHETMIYPKSRHLKLVSICLILMVAAILMGVQLYCLREKLSFSIPNVIVVAQIVSGLVLYFLYMYNTRQDALWEELDDYVYFIKGACRTFEFILIVVVLGYRLLDTSSKWTVFQIVMVILHLYVNVYLSLKDGWKSIQLRRLVSKKLNFLPKASKERLEQSEDVCPICLEELQAARITPCNHLFHMLCLKKWLNVQDKCPMCHAIILQNKQN